MTLHGLTRYTTDLATLFHKFYNACKVIGDDEPLMQARIALCEATRTTLKNALTVLESLHPFRCNGVFDSWRPEMLSGAKQERKIINEIRYGRPA